MLVDHCHLGLSEDFLYLITHYGGHTALNILDNLSGDPIRIREGARRKEPVQFYRSGAI